jgi:hypothetical protein
MNYSLPINQTQEQNLTIYGNAFIKGLEANTILSANTSACFNDVLWFYYHELPLQQIKMYYGSFDDMLFNTTQLIANMSMDLMICTSMAEDIWGYIWAQFDQFGGSLASYGLAAFQHVVANMISLSMIYQSVLADTTVTMNITDSYYQMGKIVYILITVPPIVNSAYSQQEEQEIEMFTSTLLQ